MTNQSPEKLVNSEQLLEMLFEEGARPSMSWLRGQRRRKAIPFLKIGGKVLFEPAQVREMLRHRFTVRGRTGNV